MESRGVSMEYGVAVTHRVVKIPKLDLNYFEE